MDIVEFDVVTGKKRTLPDTARRALDQPRHFADLARIVTEAKPNLAEVERYLADVHPEMLETLREKVHLARNPPPAPPRPTRKRSRR